jgi:hypothetical protein
LQKDWAQYLLQDTIILIFVADNNEAIIRALSFASSKALQSASVLWILNNEKLPPDFTKFQLELSPRRASENLYFTVKAILDRASHPFLVDTPQPDLPMIVRSMNETSVALQHK